MKNYDWIKKETSAYGYYPSSFESEEAKRLLESFHQYITRSIHYSIDDVECPSDCPAFSSAECPSSFESEEAKRSLELFPRSIHYWIDDVECPSDFPAFSSAECPSGFKKFVIKNGSLVEMTDQKRIRSDGFGMVFREDFHGEPMAMKCMPMGKMIKRNFVSETVTVNQGGSHVYHMHTDSLLIHLNFFRD